MGKFAVEFGEQTATMIADGGHDARLVPTSGERAQSVDAPVFADLLQTVASDRQRFAAKVRAGRAILGWSQTELGRRSGLSQRSIHRLELGAVDVRRSTVVSLETVFAQAGVNFEHLAGGGFKVVVAMTGPARQ